jgi:hypothetical protein
MAAGIIGNPLSAAQEEDRGHVSISASGNPVRCQSLHVLSLKNLLRHASFLDNALRIN